MNSRHWFASRRRGAFVIFGAIESRFYPL
jgi:hypothetical protein